MNNNNNFEEKKGLNSFAIRMIAYVFLLLYLFSKRGLSFHFRPLYYTNWIAFPLFAFLLAEGFSKSSNRVRYLIRLLLFAAIAEIPYNFVNSGLWINSAIQNGMFTLVLGFLVLWALDFISKKLNNMVIDIAAIYFISFAAYKLATLLHLEFASFGIMFIVFFYVSQKITYPKLLQLFLVAMLAFYVASENYITLHLGSMQYALPYKALSFLALIPIWFYNEKRGPNKLPLQISFYLAYPLLLAITAIMRLTGFSFIF